MSIDAMRWAFEQNIKPSSVKFVLVSLGDNATEDGMAWPSLAALCKKTGQDRKTVISSLDRLEAAGFLSDSGQRRGGTGQVKVYRFNFDRQNSTENGTVPKTEPFRNSIETVPDFPNNSTVFPRNSTENGTRKPKNPKEPKGKPKTAQAPSIVEPEWKALDALIAAGVDKKTAADWLKLRKGKSAAVTETVVDAATEQATKAGMTLAEALKISCLRGWTGYKAEWLLKHVEEEKTGGSSQGAWFATEQSVAAKGAEFGLKAHPGESAFTFKNRVQAAVDNGGVVPVVVSGQSVRPRQPVDVEPKAQVSPENRKAALAAARNLKPKGFDGPPP
jgi:hypothetical protein